MLEIFRELRGLLRVSHVHIDSWVFRLHYSVTTTCLFAFSLIVSAKQYVGNPIDCIHSKDIPEEVLNTYCWIHSTYTIPSAFWKRIGFDVAHPGVDKTLDPEERRYHKYYQWVCFCLFFQVSTTIMHIGRSNSSLPQNYENIFNPRSYFRFMSSLSNSILISFKRPLYYFTSKRSLETRRIFVSDVSFSNFPVLTLL